MIKYEIEIHNDRIAKVLIEKDKKMIELDMSKEIKDVELFNRLANVKTWLKIHPVSGNTYYMDEKEYQDYKEFMENKRYLK